MHDVPENLLYSKDHEWIEIDGDIGTIGISDHAQAELSDVVFVDLPEVGATVAAGDPVAVVESVKAASDVYTPVSGEILEVNEELSNDPSLINSDSSRSRLAVQNPPGRSHGNGRHDERHGLRGILFLTRSSLPRPGDSIPGHFEFNPAPAAGLHYLPDTT